MTRFGQPNLYTIPLGARVGKLPGSRYPGAAPDMSSHGAVNSSAAETARTARGRVQVREYAENDRGQVLTLHRQVFGPGWTDNFGQRLSWAHEQGLFPGETRSWVLSNNGDVVGFLGALPFKLRIGGAELIAHTSSDYMVDPRFRFHGISLMKRFMNECQDCVTFDDIPTSIAVTTWLGAKQSGTVTRYVKILDARELRRRPGFGWFPELPLRAATGSARVALKAGSIVTRRSVPATGIIFQPVPGFDRRFDAFAQLMSNSAPARVVKDRAFLEWRYGSTSPQSNREILVATDAPRSLRGYVIIQMPRGGSRNGYILDLETVKDADGTIAEQLLRLATRRLVQLGAWTARFHSTLPAPHPRLAALRRQGFFRRGGHQVLVRLHDAALQEAAMCGTGWDLSYGDIEPSHSAP